MMMVDWSTSQCTSLLDEAREKSEMKLIDGSCHTLIYRILSRVFFFYPFIPVEQRYVPFFSDLDIII